MNENKKKKTSNGKKMVTVNMAPRHRLNENKFQIEIRHHILDDIRRQLLLALQRIRTTATAAARELFYLFFV